MSIDTAKKTTTTPSTTIATTTFVQAQKNC